MIARVVEVADGNIYLEVDSQIRFRAPFNVNPSIEPLQQNDLIEFHFARHHGCPCVTIDAVIAGGHVCPGAIRAEVVHTATG